MACIITFKDKEYTSEEFKSKVLTGDIVLPEDNSGILYNTGDIPATIPSEKTINLVKEILKRIGVDLEVFSKAQLKEMGMRTDWAGMADTFEKVVYLVEGREKFAITEEVAHMAVEIVKQTNPTLYREMFNKIGNYGIYAEVKNSTQYREAYRTEDGKLDIPKLKDEAIGKMLAEYIVKLADDTDSEIEDLITDSPTNVAYAQTWWQKVLDFLKELFQKSDINPYEQLANSLIAGENIGTADDIKASGTYFQFENQSKLYDNFIAVNQQVAKTDTGFKVNDELVKTPILNKFKDESVGFTNLKTRAKNDIENILYRYINKDGLLREEILPIEEYKAEFKAANQKNAYQILENNITERLKEYPEGTKFLHNINIYDGKTRAANVDFIAITPSGKVDILVWDAISGISEAKGDITNRERKRMQEFIGVTKQILRTAYNVKDFGKTRAIPIIINYKAEDNKIQIRGLKIGNPDTNKEERSFLQPIPTSDERTGIKKIDKFLDKLNALYKNIEATKVTEGRRDIKSQQLTDLFKAIRSLQINQNFKPLFHQVDALIENGRRTLLAHRQEFANVDLDSLSNTLINDEAGKLLNLSEAVDIYKDIDIYFKDYLIDSENKEDLNEVKRLSSAARDIADDINELSQEFSRKYIAEKRGIKNLLVPETSVSGVSKYFRTLSSARTKAAQTLWKIVEETRGQVEFETSAEIEKLIELQQKVEEWATSKGLKINEYANLIKRKDAKGNYTNTLIDEYSTEFYKTLKAKIDKKEIKWIKDNIDQKAFAKWAEQYKEYKLKQIQDIVFPGTEEEAKFLKEKSIAEVLSKTNLDNDFAYLNYNVVKRFPIDSWYSNEYKELNKKENAPVKEFYDYIKKWNSEALDTEYLTAEVERTFLPFIRKGFVEKVFFGGSYNFIENTIANLTIDDQAVGYGHFNTLTGQIEDSIPIYFTSDISRENADGERDYSNVSEDIFKNIAVYVGQVINYKYKKQVENQANLLYFVEKNKNSLKTNHVGKFISDSGDAVVQDNTKNAEFFRAFLKNTIYGQRYVSTESQDIVFGRLGKPWNSFAEGANKRFGTNLPTISEEIGDRKLSATRLIDAANRAFTLKTLGLNIGSSISQLLGGNFQALINSGKYYNSQEFFANELKYSTHKLIKNNEDVHLAFMKEMLPLSEGELAIKIRNMSLSKVNRYDVSDLIMTTMRQADHLVQYANFLTMVDNAVVIDGEIRNVRDYYRGSEEYINRYNINEIDRKSLEKAFESKIKELKEQFGIEKFASVKEGKLSIEGVSQKSIFEYRSLIQQIGKNAAGNISPNDESLIRLSVLGRSAMVFKNWIPRQIDIRAGELHYNVGSDIYEWGRLRMVAKVIGQEGLKSIGTLRNMLIANAKGVEGMKALYEKKRKDFYESTGTELEMTEAEFYDLVRQNIKSQIRETIVLLSLLAMIFAAKALAPDNDEDKRTKSFYNYTMRILDKVKGEVSFYYNPTDLQGILNGSLFPALGILTDASKIVTSSVSQAFGFVTQNDEIQDKAKPTKYVMRALPVSKEMLNYIAVFYPELAQELGVKMTSQSRVN